MSTLEFPAARRRERVRPRLPLTRVAPALVAAVFAAAYVIISPPSLDLAAHLFRAQLFRDEGFGVWNNYWYSGHHIVGYSLLFPAVSAALTPQLAAGLATIGSAALFELLAYRHFGERAWLGAVLFAAGTATDLYTGRLAFAFGALPALAAVVVLDRERVMPAAGLALLSALCSPVAALFAALGASGFALGGYLEQRSGGYLEPRALRAAIPGVVVAIFALAPVLLFAIAFPEGGSEPFLFSTMFPIVALSALGAATVPAGRVRLRAGIAIYVMATVGAYLIPSPVGSNIARLGAFLGAPLAALAWWPARRVLLAITILPLLYLGWEAPVRDVSTSASDKSTATGYYQPLLRFLRAQSRPPAAPFRTEIPFTQFHWEAYVVATDFPLARGWERQLDTKDNPLFYSGHLTAAAYERWLHQNAVRFVAAPDAQLDYSAHAEMALIDRGLPYLHLVMRSVHWRVYEVAGATPIVGGAARLQAMGPDWLQMYARRPGTVLVHVRFTPYWALSEGSGCVAPAGAYTRLTLTRPGPVRMVTSFSLNRIAATSPRCT